MALTAAEKVAARRHAGYPVLRSFPTPGSPEAAVEAALVGLGAEEETVARSMLSKLDELENDLFEIRENSDTAKAAVWERNPQEMQERESNYRAWRRRFCAFMGIPMGETAGVPIPAVFTV